MRTSSLSRIQKGHAKEIHVVLGQATCKEAEANNEADKRLAKAIREHAIPEMVMENHKIKAQQTKIIQRMLIDIQNERRKQHWFQKLDKHQHEEIAQTSRIRSMSRG